jgi:hypothetical protein
MSSLIEVPPVETMDSTFKYFPKSLTTEETCRANSLVGTKMRATVSDLSDDLTLNCIFVSVDELENRNNKSSSFSGTVFGSCDNALAYGVLVGGWWNFTLECKR